jgi:hypothetical protein
LETSTLSAAYVFKDRESVDNNVMHAKPDLRVLLKWMINRSGSVITDVILAWLGHSTYEFTHPVLARNIFDSCAHWRYSRERLSLAMDRRTHSVEFERDWVGYVRQP